jgi:hypothetical protein
MNKKKREKYFREESVEGIVATTNSLVRWHLTVRRNTMFKTVEFPTSITNLNTGLTNVDRNTFAHVIDLLFLVKTELYEERKGAAAEFFLSAQASFPFGKCSQ